MMSEANKRFRIKDFPSANDQQETKKTADKVNWMDIIKYEGLVYP